MFKTLYIREIQNYLYGLRFQVSFVIVLLVFAVGSISFVHTYDEVQSNYAKAEQARQTQITELASENVSRLATRRFDFVISPRINGVIADCKESILPNSIRYSAYNVYGFSVMSGNQNPLIVQADTLSWSFIVSMFLSFITLLFAFDAISGEKEEHTLALVFSNPVPRRVFLFSKLASIVTVVTLMAVVGMIVSILILLASGKAQLDGSLLLEIVGFTVFCLLLITVFAVFGLLASALTTHSNVSLLISLCFWLFAAVIIPNTAVFWANKLFPIPSSDEVSRAHRQESGDINNNAPEGSWSSSSNNPFFPRHELRGNLRMKLMECEKRHYDQYYNQMFRQFEQTRAFTLLSPIAQYDYINEAFLGGGYLRFRTNWDNLHTFQNQYFQWFKDVDAKDDKSPHWYNPEEDYSTSRLPVSSDIVPRYTEQYASFGQRFRFIAGYLAVMICTVGILFSICFFRFTRYDVR